MLAPRLSKSAQIFIRFARFGKAAPKPTCFEEDSSSSSSVTSNFTPVITSSAFSFATVKPVCSVFCMPHSRQYSSNSEDPPPDDSTGSDPFDFESYDYPEDKSQPKSVINAYARFMSEQGKKLPLNTSNTKSACASNSQKLPSKKINKAEMLTKYTEETKTVNDNDASSEHTDVSSSSSTSMLHQIFSWLDEHHVSYEFGYTCIHVDCVVSCASKETKVYIDGQTGHFYCKSCSIHGNWASCKTHLLADVTEIKRVKPMKFSAVLQPVLQAQLDSRAAPELKSAFDLYYDAIPINQISADERKKIFRNFRTQFLRARTLSEFGVRVDASSGRLLLPYFDLDGTTLLGLKILTAVHLRGRKSCETTFIPSERFLLPTAFGLSLALRSNSSTLVVTDSELNAMAISQSTDLPVISLRNIEEGISQELYPFLERFTRIVLWTGQDFWSAAKQLTLQLSPKRCSYVSDLSDSPLESLQKNDADLLLAKLQEAKPIHNASITSFRDLRTKILYELENPNVIAGTQWSEQFKPINEILKGHRPGELTVFTGPTGAGKTTFISNYSLDLCMQGVNTLWGSFEINNIRLAKSMLSQFACTNLSSNISEFSRYADQFEALHMYFMTFHGAETIAKVIETMTHSVSVFDIRHVIIDNLQFMMGCMDRRSADRFLRQDRIIEQLRRFSTDTGCHVTVVIHPRKEKHDDPLSINSVFGSAKATQEADNLIILQSIIQADMSRLQYLEVVKNRFDGQLGKIGLKFDKSSLNYICTPFDHRTNSPQSAKVPFDPNQVDPASTNNVSTAFNSAPSAFCANGESPRVLKSLDDIEKFLGN